MSGPAAVGLECRMFALLVHWSSCICMSMKLNQTTVMTCRRARVLRNLIKIIASTQALAPLASLRARSCLAVVLVLICHVVL